MQIEQCLVAILSLLSFQLIIGLLITSIFVIPGVRYLYKKKFRQAGGREDAECGIPTIEKNQVHSHEPALSEPNTDKAIAVTSQIETTQTGIFAQDEALLLFEQFVNNCLEEIGFTKGSEKLTSRNELLTYSSRHGAQLIQFAVFCLWRPGFIKGRLEWAKSYELVNYRQCQSEYGIPIYIVVGVGGSPSAPGKVSFVPLKQVRSNVLSETQIRTQNSILELSGVVQNDLLQAVKFN